MFSERANPLIISKGLTHVSILAHVFFECFKEMFHSNMLIYLFLLIHFMLSYFHILLLRCSVIPIFNVIFVNF